MYTIGLTGGIGTGKSTVASMLQELGAVILSADLVGHEVYQPGRPAWQEIVDVFGRDVVAEDGAIDRRKLGAIVFADPAQLKRLNAITHPRMKGMMRETLAQLEGQGTGIGVLEAALLFEAGWDDLADEIWVTIAPPGVAADRTAERTGLPREEILRRIQAQMTNEERMGRSHVIIDTDCALVEVRQQVAEQWRGLQRRLSAASARSNV